MKASCDHTETDLACEACMDLLVQNASKPDLNAQRPLPFPGRIEGLGGILNLTELIKHGISSGVIPAVTQYP